MTEFLYEPLMNRKGVEGMCVFPSSDDMTSQAISEYESFGIMPEQTHSLNVAVVEKRNDRFPDTDALISFSKDLPVGVRTADCVPILIYAPDVRGISAVHAGWKGTLGGIIDNVIETFRRYGAAPEEMIVSFGPSISKERYEVDTDLAQRFIEAGFEDYVSYPEGNGKKPHLDLQGINAERLIRLGVKKENMTLHPGCTFSSRDSEGKFLYQSHRRSGGKPGRNFTFIKLVD